MPLIDDVRAATRRSARSSNELADGIGATKQTIDNFVNGQSTLSSENLEKLATYLGIGVAHTEKTNIAWHNAVTVFVSLSALFLSLYSLWKDDYETLRQKKAEFRHLLQEAKAPVNCEVCAGGKSGNVFSNCPTILSCSDMSNLHVFLAGAVSLEKEIGESLEAEDYRALAELVAMLHGPKTAKRYADVGLTKADPNGAIRNLLEPDSTDSGSEFAAHDLLNTAKCLQTLASIEFRQGLVESGRPLHSKIVKMLTYLSTNDIDEQMRANLLMLQAFDEASYGSTEIAMSRFEAAKDEIVNLPRKDEFTEMYRRALCDVFEAKGFHDAEFCPPAPVPQHSVAVPRPQTFADEPAQDTRGFRTEIISGEK